MNNYHLVLREVYGWLTPVNSHDISFSSILVIAFEQILKRLFGGKQLKYSGFYLLILTLLFSAVLYYNLFLFHLFI